ncbi:translocation and assembly module lipoprotein TamL [Aureibaculum algae]|uniref:translocation and assembly module lipoprotein TamL n=1 Tax=Aureibaculum algae TaxID=2584122 RepID=UPI001586A0A9|nr:BamA/TamA family outer membrane protein [Aureibaculum algae]
MLNYFAKIIVFIILTVVIISCTATKRVPQDKYLLSKNTIVVDDKKISNPDVISYLRQTPNTKILGIPISLHIYNFAKPNYEIKFQEWLDKNPNKERKLVNVFSQKQVKAMENAYNGINVWFLKNGNAPVISDSTKIRKSVSSLTKYYQSKGYFDAEVSFKQIKKDNKKITVDYLVTKNNPYFIDSITTDISSPVLDSLYKMYRGKSLVKVGDQIDYTKFEKEEDRLIEIFRNSGVYYFGKNNMEYWIDTLGLSPYRTSVTLEINDRVIEKNDSVYTEPFKIRKVSKVNVYTDFSFVDKNKPILDSVSYKGYNFKSTNKLAYNPKYLANAIIIQKDSIYRDTEQQLTRAYLRDLQNFKPSLDIKYEENEDGSLTSNIYLTPQKKFSFGIDNEYITSNIKPFGILGKVSWSNRNVFRGAEVLEVSFQGSFLNVAAEIADSDRFFNAYEIGSSATLKFPRILFPINTKGIIPKRMTPKTNVELSIALQRNIGLDRQNITGGLNYTWKSSKTTDHKFELLNMQYIKNLRTDKYFTIYKSEAYKLDDIAEVIVPDETYTTVGGENLYDSDGDLNSSNYLEYLLDADEGFSVSNPTEYENAEDVEERRSILTEDVLVPVMSYTYNYSNRDGFTDNSFSGFTAKLVSSGNITSMFVNKSSASNKKELFGLEIAQYIKTEVEYKKYWGINSKATLVHRTFIGAAFPMGSSESIPFSRSYRAGGSNDIRAWNTFKLGPGSETNGLEFNVGSLKLTSNLEYRFQVVNNIYSALFIDAGNIWDITNSSITDSKAKFNGLSSLKDIAVGSGFGIRYDFSFLVFRLDAGFKTYEPYLGSSNKWFKNYNFGNAVYNIGINYPF